MSPPRNLTELRRFRGMINFYYRFVLCPLHDLVNKGKREFLWSTEHTAAYDLAKTGDHPLKQENFSIVTLSTYPRLAETICLNFHKNVYNSLMNERDSSVPLNLKL